MNHRPFEDWLLEETPLSPVQQAELEAHLAACPACRALAEVNLALHTARLLDPPPGFLERFQKRLAVERAAMQRRTFFGWFLLTLGGVLLLLWFAWPFLAGELSPLKAAGEVWVTLVNLLVSLQVFLRSAQTLFQVVPDFLLGALWLTLLAALGLWGSLWALSLQKFARLTQGVSR